MKILLKIVSNYGLIFLIISLGVFFRVYNLNYEDFWIDEILSFWISDPSLSFKETLERHNNIEQIPIFFNLILKYFFKLFGYNAYFSRYLVSTFSVLSLILSFLLISQISNKKNFIIFFFFINFI